MNKIIKYRSHRGGLSASLKTTIEVQSKQELYDYLKQDLVGFNKKILDIKFEYSMYDKRIDWDTYYVLVLLEDEKNYFVAGMSNGIL